MTALQYLQQELKLEPEEAISLNGFLQNWTSYKPGVAKFLERRAWRNRTNTVIDPKNISDRLLGHQLGVADGIESVTKIIDSLVDSVVQAGRN